MRTIYFARLSIKRGASPAVIDDVEFGDVPSLNVFLAEVAEVDSASYILVSSGEREVPFTHKMKGDTLTVEFRMNAAATSFSESVKKVASASESVGTSLHDMRVARTGVDESVEDYFDRLHAISNMESRFRKVKRVGLIAAVAAVVALVAWGITS